MSVVSGLIIQCFTQTAYRITALPDVQWGGTGCSFGQQMSTACSLGGTSLDDDVNECGFSVFPAYIANDGGTSCSCCNTVPTSSVIGYTAYMIELWPPPPSPPPLPSSSSDSHLSDVGADSF
uniref:Uncharacterized protein n=1 Tax=Haptolina ericina TaxID=156174 RepID=A0A7S3ER62_9EUKA|mmetsp:Transcript_15387/g.34400  ORF Transcript_15387/g.34400 Transcript_15387/m.34400 type:complete len:122 (+) Transcript_15387:20-385(+)